MTYALVTVATGVTTLPSHLPGRPPCSLVVPPCAPCFVTRLPCVLTFVVSDELMRAVPWQGRLCHPIAAHLCLKCSWY